MKGSIYLAGSTLLSLALAGQIKLVKNSTDDLYFEHKAQDGTIGYSFSLYQNVLSVQLNATEACQSCGSSPASLIIMPDLLLEYNNQTGANSTTRVYGFLNKANANTDWGKGLSASTVQGKALNGSETVEVWHVNATWKNPEGGRPEFGAHMYFASKPAEYQNMTLNAHSILVRYSILNFPFNMTNSSLGYEQVVLAKSGAGNLTIANLTNPQDDGAITYLRVNTTALIDGSAQNFTVSQLNNTAESLSILVGNSTRLNVTGYEPHALFFGFNNSYNAKNVTFDQRLVLNMTEYKQKRNPQAYNAATSSTSSVWFALGALMSSLAVLVPALLL